jgi:hypothetical protein
MSIVFQLLQWLLAALILAPTMIVAAYGSGALREFATVIVPTLVWLFAVSGLAQWLRTRGRPGAGIAVLALGFLPFGLLVWFIIGLAEAFRSG